MNEAEQIRQDLAEYGIKDPELIISESILDAINGYTVSDDPLQQVIDFSNRITAYQLLWHEYQNYEQNCSYDEKCVYLYQGYNLADKMERLHWLYRNRPYSMEFNSLIKLGQEIMCYALTFRLKNGVEFLY